MKWTTCSWGDEGGRSGPTADVQAGHQGSAQPGPRGGRDSPGREAPPALPPTPAPGRLPCPAVPSSLIPAAHWSRANPATIPGAGECVGRAAPRRARGLCAEGRPCPGEARLPLRGRPGHPPGAPTLRRGQGCPSAGAAGLPGRGGAGRAGPGSGAGTSALHRRGEGPSGWEGRPGALHAHPWDLESGAPPKVRSLSRGASPQHGCVRRRPRRSCRAPLRASPVCPLFWREKEAPAGSRYPSGSTGVREGSYWARLVSTSMGDWASHPQASKVSRQCSCPWGPEERQSGPQAPFWTPQDPLGGGSSTGPKPAQTFP